MPALLPTDFTATITWLGRVDDRTATLRANPVSEVRATYAGVAGDEHAGLTRPACSRTVAQYPKGTEIPQCAAVLGTVSRGPGGDCAGYGG